VNLIRSVGVLHHVRDTYQKKKYIYCRLHSKDINSTRYLELQNIKITFNVEVILSLINHGYILLKHATVEQKLGFMSSARNLHTFSYFRPPTPNFLN
jgi:hypothetical protein